MAASDVTELLRQAREGRAGALERLMPIVYEDLRKRASAYLGRERPDHTLQTTALVNEAYLRLVDQDIVDLTDRAHFFALAATCMRRVLVDHARVRAAEKRGGAWQRVPIDDLATASIDAADELLSLDEALTRLAEQDERKAKVVELRFFVGLSIDEIADVLDRSPRTVDRDLLMARTWLLRELETREGP